MAIEEVSFPTPWSRGMFSEDFTRALLRSLRRGGDRRRGPRVRRLLDHRGGVPPLEHRRAPGAAGAGGRRGAPVRSASAARRGRGPSGSTSRCGPGTRPRSGSTVDAGSCSWGSGRGITPTRGRMPSSSPGRYGRAMPQGARGSSTGRSSGTRAAASSTGWRSRSRNGSTSSPDSSRWSRGGRGTIRSCRVLWRSSAPAASGERDRRVRVQGRRARDGPSVRPARRAIPSRSRCRSETGSRSPERTVLVARGGRGRILHRLPGRRGPSTGNGPISRCSSGRAPGTSFRRGSGSPAAPSRAGCTCAPTTGPPVSSGPSPRPSGTGSIGGNPSGTARVTILACGPREMLKAVAEPPSRSASGSRCPSKPHGVRLRGLLGVRHGGAGRGHDGVPQRLQGRTGVRREGGRLVTQPATPDLSARVGSCSSRTR